MDDRAAALYAEVLRQRWEVTGDDVVRLLVVDDGALRELRALLKTDEHARVTVLTKPERCRALLAGDPAWTGRAAIAMARDDLGALPAAALVPDLTLRDVSRDGAAGVALGEAVAAAARADPRITDEDAIARTLRSWPGDVRLFAATDADGAVRATAGSAVYGTSTTVLFVNTDSGWRGRGVGRAMTIAALEAARRGGATQAALDATAAARPLYERLGFAVAGEVSHWRRDPSRD